MVLSTATLSNCYTPLPLPRPDPSSPPTNDDELGSSSSSTSVQRDGGRAPRALRRLHLSRSVLAASSGSSLVELGQTKVICSVRGPRSSGSSSLAMGGGAGGGEWSDGGVLNVEVRYAPQFGVNPEIAAMGTHAAVDAPSHGGTSGGGHNLMTEESELASRLRDAILPAVLNLDALTKSAVDVLCVVLQSDGGILGACCAAASVALVDAGVEMADTVGSCTVAAVASAGGNTAKGGNDEKEEEELILLVDPTETELRRAAGTVTIAMLPTFREVTSWEQTGRLPPEVSRAALEVCRDGCSTMQKFMRNCLVGSSSSDDDGENK